MAITKTLENDKIEVQSGYLVHVRKATVIKEDGVELTRTFHRHVVDPGELDASDNLVARDISGEDADVQAICNASWTQAVKDAWKAKLISEKTA
tara:strand:- start:51 stop:332 length:282 start_codon:yes stop_codon:yes gene_type:complete